MARARVTAKMRRNRAIPFALGGHQRWSVIWAKSDKDEGYRLFRHECGNDLDEAIRVYTKAKEAGRRVVTLHSDNVGYPPPEKLMPYKKWVVRRVKKRKRKVLATIKPMSKLNRKGIWWCPYCRALRKFQLQEGFHLWGIFVEEKGMYCPICGISNKDFHVRKHNPVAFRIYVTGGM